MGRSKITGGFERRGEPVERSTSWTNARTKSWPSSRVNRRERIASSMAIEGHQTLWTRGGQRLKYLPVIADDEVETGTS